MKKYIALFETDAGGGYCVVFPDFPGAVSAGDTLEEAKQNAREMIAFHVECMREDNLPIPEPRTFEQIKAEWEDWPEWEQDYTFIVEEVELIEDKR